MSQCARAFWSLVSKTELAIKKRWQHVCMFTGAGEGGLAEQAGDADSQKHALAEFKSAFCSSHTLALSLSQQHSQHQSNLHHTFVRVAVLDGATMKRLHNCKLQAVRNDAVKPPCLSLPLKDASAMLKANTDL